MRRKRSMQGEIVEVEGGRIIRALARKDRHSKVCTAKGPKDRRVRLSATTAIRFYDVQDRLGYDRPSLAIDWLMNEAKPAIDALNGGDHLVTAMKSSTPSNIALSHYFHQTSQELEGYYSVPDYKGNLVLQELPLCVGSRGGSIPYGFNINNKISENGIENQLQNVSEFQTSCFDSFFNNYPESLNSRNMGLFSAKTTLEEGREETVQFQRMVAWNSVPSSSNVKESVQEYDIGSSLQWHLRHFSDQNHALFTQREPLQSSYLPSVQGSVPALNTSFGIGFANDGLMGFSFPARIGGQEEKQENLVSEELSSASSLLHYQDQQSTRFIQFS